jgi:hypothetical protein
MLSFVGVFLIASLKWTTVAMKTFIHYMCCWIAVVLSAWRCAPATALIVAPAAANDNTSAPADDPGWLNVGDRGVYLGNRWVLTVAHVGEGTTLFPGVGTFFHQSGSRVQLQNPDSSLTDLVLYRITADPGLPSLKIATMTPTIGTEVTFIGDGGAVNPSDTETYWNVTGTDPNFTWTEVSVSDPHNASGYKSTTSRKLWGTNLVEDDATFFSAETDPDHTVFLNPGAGAIHLFLTEFDKSGETDGSVTAHEAQAQGGDSGSGVFAKESGEWVLAGISDAVGGFEDQPDPGTNAVFGNLTFAADLFRYRSQITTIVGVPEPGGFLLVGCVGAMIGLARLVVRRPW